MPTIRPNLAWHKEQAVNEVNQLIGSIRLKYITDIPGQDSLYQAKKNMAIKYLAELPATLDGYYLIEKEVGITAPTALELCQVWLNMNALWEVIAGDLENIRVPANANIMAAVTKTEINQFVANTKTAIDTTGY